MGSTIGWPFFFPKKEQTNPLWIDVEAEAPILWPPDVKSWFTGKDPDARKNWGQEKKSVTEDEMVGWHHWLNRHEFEQILGDSEGQGSLACCSPRNLRVSWTQLSDWTMNTIFGGTLSYLPLECHSTGLEEMCRLYSEKARVWTSAPPLPWKAWSKITFLNLFCQSNNEQHDSYIKDPV